MERAAYAADVPKLEEKIAKLEQKQRAGTISEKEKTSLRILTTMRDQARGSVENYRSY
jgi:hypothetical protein